MIRDYSCDIRIVNKEISRKHAELYVESGAVFLNSMGREPVSVNGEPVTSPLQLSNGDKIEVHLSGRTRVFYFYAPGKNKTVSRSPLKSRNAQIASIDEPKQHKSFLGKPIRTSPKHDAAMKEEHLLQNKEDSLEPKLDPQPMLKENSGIPQGEGVVHATTPRSDRKENVEPTRMPNEGDTSHEEVKSVVHQIVEQAMKAAMLTPGKHTSKSPSVAVHPGEITLTVSQMVQEAFCSALNTLEEKDEQIQAIEEGHHEAGRNIVDGPNELVSPDETVGKNNVEREEVTTVVVDLVRQAFQVALASSLELDHSDALMHSENGTGDATVVVSDLVKQAFERVLADDDETSNPLQNREEKKEFEMEVDEHDARTSDGGNDTQSSPVVSTGQYSPQGPGDVTMTVAEMIKEAFKSVLNVTNSTQKHQEQKDASADDWNNAPSEPRASSPRDTIVNAISRDTPKMGGPPSQKKHASLRASHKKSVRFSTPPRSYTPDGAAADATVTLSFCPADNDEEVVCIEDSTLNIAQWARGLEQENEEDLDIPHVTPTSVENAPTPGGPGPRAPAPTPASGMRNRPGTMDSKTKDAMTGRTIDPQSLMSKLNELSEDHDITFELPADFMQWTPGPKPNSLCASTTTGTCGTKMISVMLTPKQSVKSRKSQGGDASAVKSARSGAKPSRLGRGGPNFDAVAYANADGVEVREDVSKGASPMNHHDDDVNCDFSEDPEGAIVASAQRPPSDQDRTPLSAVHRRSSFRTPGTKIAIITNGTPAGRSYSSVKKPEKCNVRGLVFPEDGVSLAKDEDAKPSGTAPSPFSGKEEEVVMTSSLEPPPTVLQSNVRRKSSTENNEDCALEQAQRSEVTGTEPMPFRSKDLLVAAEGVPLGEYRQMVLKYKSYRQQSVRLARRLHHVSGHALKLQRTMKRMRSAFQQEQSRCKELQKTVRALLNQRDVADSDATKEGSIGGDMEIEWRKDVFERGCGAQFREHDVEMQEAKEEACRFGSEISVETEPEDPNEDSLASEEATQQPKQCVVVVGYTPSNNHVNTVEQAGQVIVLRPSSGRYRSAPSEDPRSARRISEVGARDHVQKLHGLNASLDCGEKAQDEKTGDHDGERKEEEEEDEGEGEQVFEAAQWEAAAVEAQAAIDEANDEGWHRMKHDQDHVDDGNEQEQEIMAAIRGEEEVEEEDVCYVCHASEEGEVLLLCDGCDNACHLTCCNPRLKRVPRGDWYCQPCKDSMAEMKASRRRNGQPVPKSSKKSGTAAILGETMSKPLEPIEERSKSDPFLVEPSEKKARSEPKQGSKRPRAASSTDMDASQNTRRTRGKTSAGDARSSGNEVTGAAKGASAPRRSSRRTQK